MEKIEKEIDGIQYAVTQYSYPKGLRIWAKLRNVLAAPLAMSVKGVFDEAAGVGDIMSKDIDVGAILDGVVSALQDLGGKMTPDEEFALMEEILENVHADGTPLTKERRVSHFAGRIGHLYKVVWFVLEANYRDFLSEITAAGRKAWSAVSEKQPGDDSEGSTSPSG